MLVNISMKFHEDILNGFQVTERTLFCDGQTDRQTDIGTTPIKSGHGQDSILDKIRTRIH